MRTLTLAFVLCLSLLAPALAAEITYTDENVSADIVLPPVRTWHHLGWDCHASNNPPEGWLRKGGYCEIIRTKDSLTFAGKNPTIIGF